MNMSLISNIISGGTVSDGYGDRPQHGSEASGGGASRSSFSNSSEPEVPRQALGENLATADPRPVPVAGQAGQGSNLIGHTRVPEPSSTSTGARRKKPKDQETSPTATRHLPSLWPAKPPVGPVFSCQV